MSQHNSETKQKSTARFAESFLHYAYNIYILATLGGIIAAWVKIDKSAAAPIISQILTIGFVLAFSITLLFLIYFALTYSQKARYAEISQNLHAIQHTIRNTLSKVRQWLAEGEPSLAAATHALISEGREKRKSEFEASLKDILSQAASIFTILTATNCRTSIKILSGNPKSGSNNLYVRTLARDALSAQSCAGKDLHEKSNPSLHAVGLNTDFELILKRQKRYFHYGDIENYADYANSSREYWEKSQPVHGSTLSWIWRHISPSARNRPSAPFPYRSVLVLPIQGLGDAEPSDVPVAFLTIDSMSKHVFNERYDVHIAASIADSLYHLMVEFARYNILTNNALNKEAK